MALSFEQILVDVYRQLFNDSADVVALETGDSQFGVVACTVCGRWTSFLKDMMCAEFNRVQMQITAGQR